MFPAFMMMDPSRRQQQQGRGARHCFGEREPQMWHFGGGHNPFHQGRSPQSEGGSDQFSPVVNLLQNLAGNYTTCSGEQRNRNNPEKKMANEKSCKCKSGGRPEKEAPKKEDGQSERPAGEECPFQPLFADIFGNIMTSFDDCHKTETPKTWRQEVDCRGFKSRHIKVKIDARLLLVKANKKENSEFGVCTSSMTKNVPLPKNIDNAKITCKLSSNGSLLIEAPYLTKTKAATHELVRDLLSNILPGLEETMKSHFGDLVNAAEKSDEKACDGNGDKEKQKEKADSGVKYADKNGVEKSSARNTDSKAKAEKACRMTPTAPNPDSKAEEEETCKMTYADKEDSTACTNEGSTEQGSAETERTAGESSVTFPEDEEQEQQTRAHEEADSVSVSSEDSFVLLSELEKEGDGHKESTPNPDGVTLVVKSEDDDDDTDKLVQQGSDGQFKSSLVEREDAGTDRNNNNNQETASVQSQKEESHTRKSEDFLFRIEMPSYNPETIKVNFDENKGILILSASKEKGSGSITKNVHIPDDVDVNSLHCSFRDGVLSVTAPYKKPMRNIPINV